MKVLDKNVYKSIKSLLSESILWELNYWGLEFNFLMMKGIVSVWAYMCTRYRASILHALYLIVMTASKTGVAVTFYYS